MNKLKVEDLMVGDWVTMYNRKGEAIGDCQVNTSMLELLETSFLSLEPIPLTPEILERNGFLPYREEDKSYRLELAEGTHIHADFMVEEPFVRIVNTCYQATPYCVYVHHLQHAMRMCGIYKKIVLKS